MKNAFNHEGLKVYQHALQFTTRAESWIAEWDKKHAICDHLPRAAASIVENIAMASAAYSGMKVKALDYALGSTLECAACVDIAAAKGLVNSEEARLSKRDLLRVFRMLVGLRRAWSPAMVREAGVEYGSDANPRPACDEREQEPEAFHHERLDMYRLALETVVLCSSLKSLGSLPTHIFCRLDLLLTSMVLNIAEGNGRFSESDQRRFLGGAHESAIKMAANLDLCVAQKALPREDADKCKTLLARVACMTAKMAGGAEYEDRQGSRQSSRQGLNRIDSDVEKAILTT